MVISAPSSLDLYGTTPEEKERSRKSDSIHLQWARVPGAVSYEVDLGSGSTKLMETDFTASNLLENTVYTCKVRAIDTEGPSTWIERPVMTRPPTPAAPVRLSYDLSIWGVPLSWNLAVTFSGRDQGKVLLWRSIETGDATSICEGRAVGEYVDYDDPAQRPKLYRLQWVAPVPDIPNIIPARQNQSLKGDSIKTEGAIYKVALQAFGSYTGGASITPRHSRFLFPRNWNQLGQV